MRNWSDVLPERVAKAQHRWDRFHGALRAHECGLSLSEIGRRFGRQNYGVTRGMAWVMIKIAKRELELGWQPPVVSYLAGQDVRCERVTFPADDIVDSDLSPRDKRRVASRRLKDLSRLCYEKIPVL